MLKIQSRHLPGVTEGKTWKTCQDGPFLGSNPRPPERYTNAIPQRIDNDERAVAALPFLTTSILYSYIHITVPVLCACVN